MYGEVYSRSPQYSGGKADGILSCIVYLFSQDRKWMAPASLRGADCTMKEMENVQHQSVLKKLIWLKKNLSSDPCDAEGIEFT